MRNNAVAVDSIKEAIQAPTPPLLLFGVTGSGKTEIYLQAIRHALSILAAPRSSSFRRSPYAANRRTIQGALCRMRSKEVAVLHSHLSGGERFDEWRKIHSGGARIVIGARSAVFAPLENLGIIIVDEEHEGTYKQEEAPRYHARDVAVLRAKQEGLRRGSRQRNSFHGKLAQLCHRKVPAAQLSQRVDDRRMPCNSCARYAQGAASGRSRSHLCARRCCKPSSNAFPMVSRRSSS